jgi:hypothetical protein
MIQTEKTFSRYTFYQGYLVGHFTMMQRDLSVVDYTLFTNYLRKKHNVEDPILAVVLEATDIAKGMCESSAAPTQIPPAN